MLMWLDHYSSACRECPDLVAVYEAIDGRLALLLRQTLVPLPEESPAFRRATRSAPASSSTSSERPASGAASSCCSGTRSARGPTSCGPGHAATRPTRHAA